MNTKGILEENNFIFKKKFGQNFLIDNNVLDNILKTADVKKSMLVIEIGVGAAALTKKLALKAGFVLGYEIDKTLEKPLEEILNPYKNVEIIFDDFLNRNIKEDIEKYEYENLIVVANLPYYITTPIINKFIEEQIKVSKIVVMVQNEVADRFSAKVGSKNYNSLTVFLNYFYNIKKAFVVKKDVFYPRPKIDSAVVVLERKEKTPYLKNENLFFNLVRDSFKFKRKTLKNNLLKYDLNKINEILSKYNKDISCRAEVITLDEFIDIANNL